MPVQRGSERPQAKLDETKVRAIREAYNADRGERGIGRRLAREYGVTPAMISKIMAKKGDGSFMAWAHVV